MTSTRNIHVGQSGPEICGLCTRRSSSLMDPGCHPNPARTSYNLNSPFTAVRGMVGSVFALKFTPGPEQYVSGSINRGSTCRQV